MILLETPRLILRQFKEEDAEAMYLLNADPEVIKYTGDAPFNTIEESLQLIRNYDQYQKYKQGRLTVVLKETNEIIGWCGLKFHLESNETDIGYRLKKSSWNKGYATEAALASIAYGFNDLKLLEIVGNAMKENAASIRVFEKIGMNYFKDSGCGREAGVVYKISKADFRK